MGQLQMKTGVMQCWVWPLSTQELSWLCPVPPAPGDRRVTQSCLPPQTGAFIDVLCPHWCGRGFFGESGPSWVLGEVQTQRGEPQTRAVSVPRAPCPSCVPTQDTPPSPSSQGCEKPPKPSRMGGNPPRKGCTCPQRRRRDRSPGAGRDSLSAAAPDQEEEKNKPRLFFRAFSLKRRGGRGAARAPSGSRRKEVKLVILGFGRSGQGSALLCPPSSPG